MRKFYFLFVLAGVIFLSNSGLHPSANTGAPGDSFCGACHTGSGGSLNGEVEITGLPSTIQPSTTYPITVTVTNPAMNASRAGFQIVALNQNNTNIGTFTNYDNTKSELRSQNGRVYFGHKPAQFFSGNSSINWTVDWTSPAISGDQITIYGSAVIANGGNGNSGDRAVLTSETGNIQGSSPLTVTVTEDFPALCFDTNDGIATATPSGGQAPFQYEWDNGATGMQATNLTGGNHEVTVTDALNETAVGSIFINSPTELTITNAGQEDATCFGASDGLAQFNGNGGTPIYDFDWSDGGSGDERYDLPAGFYTITITDNNGCSASTSVTINEPPAIEVVETITDLLCAGDDNGSIFLSASGGNGSLAFDWSNGSTNQNQFDLEAGFYDVTITDVNNCQNIYQYEVMEPSELSISIDNISDASCANTNDGIGELSGNGGAGSYVFNWSDGVAGPVRNDLSPDKYYITIVDGNQCSSIDSLTIDSPTPITIDSVSSSNASCPGVNDGSLEVIGNGGNGSLSYLWFDNTMSPVIQNITSGSYSVTVTDQSNCSSELTLTIGSQSAATLTLDTVINLSCFGDTTGIIAVSLNNGADYNINWSNGNEGSADSTLSAGTYTIQASNPVGCESNTLSIDITEPMEITMDSLLTIDPNCFGDQNGEIQVDFVGGTGNYSYQWSNGKTSKNIDSLIAGIYEVTVFDDNNCQTTSIVNLVNPDSIHVDTSIVTDLLCFGDSTGMIAIEATGGTGNLQYIWDTGDSLEIIDFLSAGDYFVTIYDTNNCEKIENFTVNQPDIINISGVVKNETTLGAADGNININVEGGTPQYSINWSNGETTDSIGGLGAGQYVVTITDLNGCSSVKSFSLSQGDCELMVSPQVVNISCFGNSDGMINLEIENNLGPVSISISGGFTQLDSLPAGEYDVTVTDTANCTTTLFDILITEPAEIIISIDTVINAIGLNNNGQINISATGGTGTLSYLWKDAVGNDISSSEDLLGISPGFYTLVVTDINGCMKIVENIEVELISSIDDLGFNIEIFPNPASDLLMVNSDLTINKLEIFNYTGKSVFQSAPFQHKFSLDLSDYNSGIYIVKIYAEGYSMHKKIIIN